MANESTARAVLNARLREFEAVERDAARNRDMQLDRVRRLEREMADANMSAALQETRRQNAEHAAERLRQVFDLPPSDADPATGVPYGELT